ncbi:MAG: hypothetical protein M1823_006157 [Watsoniomyces obsoletus]|nr:MAG: hypothetical protein M1823_006157 [Watsoniomyces obsoletus]
MTYLDDPPQRSRDMVLDRRQVESLIARGQTILIVDDRVLRVDAWMKYHPGGEMAIRHVVGRDATDEVNALHSAEARQRMKNYQIGRIEGAWINFVPPIQGGVFVDEDEGVVEKQAIPTTDISPAKPSSGSGTLEQETDSAYLDRQTEKEIDLDLARFPPLDPSTQGHIVQAYRELHDQIRAEGLFQCNYWAYAVEVTRYLMFFGLFLLFLRWGWYATSGLFLGIFWHQLVFSAHDAGHMGITHDFTIDTTIGIIIADFLGGLSLGWWKRSHNVHHIVTNRPEHDPDIELMPFFAISHRFFSSLYSSYYQKTITYDAFSKFIIRYQAWLYYPILAFGRFNLYVHSWDYLLNGLGPRKGAAWWHRWFEIAGQIFFWTWFGYGVVYASIPNMTQRIIFILVSHMVTMPLHVQITLSHFAMSTADLGVHESFPQRMLRTTMDVDCPEWLDFVHGGLQFQAIHHLYPRIPRHNLRRTQKLVQRFCEDVEIPYALLGFVDGNKKVVGRLGEIGRQASILAQCQQTIAKKTLSGLAH